MHARTFAITAGSLLALGLGFSACGGTSESQGDPRPAAGADQAIYKATVTVAEASGERPLVEWLDPSSGAWRSEQEGETRIFSGDTYAVIDEWGMRLRIGSPEFLGRRAELSLTMEPVRAYLSGRAKEDGVRVAQTPSGELELAFTRNEVGLVATVERLPVSAARRADLFGIPAEPIAVEERELAAGSPAVTSLRAYWLGPAVDVRLPRQAALAVQYRATATPAMQETGVGNPQSEVDNYMVFYEDSAAGGKTSATSSAPLPANELQVVSQPLDSSTAQQDLQAFDGILGDLTGPPWPRRTIVLANGERATLFIDDSEETLREGISFAVATSSTLVHVMGDVKPGEIVQLARKLTPVG
jgi:hypothetical protein